MFLNPKNRLEHEVKWNISSKSKAIISTYADYTSYNENEIIDQLILQLLTDESFEKWVLTKKKSNRLIAELYPEKHTKRTSNSNTSKVVTSDGDTEEKTTTN